MFNPDLVSVESFALSVIPNDDVRVRVKSHFAVALSLVIQLTQYVPDAFQSGFFFVVGFNYYPGAERCMSFAKHELFEVTVSMPQFLGFVVNGA